MEDVIDRTKYDSKILPFINKAIIKVLVGQRRVGKSYLLKHIQTLIKPTSPDTIIEINKEDEAFNFIENNTHLTKYINEKADGTKGKVYIFIDEIQEIENFENTIRSFQARAGFDIYITGSNSEMLSGELATRLSGRYIEIPIFSLDFTEFLTFHNLSNSMDSLRTFQKYGGLPFLKHLSLSDEVAYDYLKNIYTTILYKDVIKRYNIRNVSFLDRLILYIADNIGQLVSAKKISDYLKSQKITVSVNLVMDYLAYLSHSYFIIPVKRYDIKGKRLFEIGEKYYFQDIGIRNALIGFRINDMGKILENMVFNHLSSHGYEINIGYWNDKEIDFVAQKNNEIIYFQVTYILSEDKTISREFGNLLEIKDNYRKLVISMDDTFTNTFQGIEHWSILKFLTEFI